MSNFKYLSDDDLKLLSMSQDKAKSVIDKIFDEIKDPNKLREAVEEATQYMLSFKNGRSNRNQLYIIDKGSDSSMWTKYPDGKNVRYVTADPFGRSNYYYKCSNLGKYPKEEAIAKCSELNNKSANFSDSQDFAYTLRIIDDDGYDLILLKNQDVVSRYEGLNKYGVHRLIDKIVKDNKLLKVFVQLEFKGYICTHLVGYQIANEIDKILGMNVKQLERYDKDSIKINSTPRSSSKGQMKTWEEALKDNDIGNTLSMELIGSHNKGALFSERLRKCFGSDCYSQLVNKIKREKPNWYLTALKEGVLIKCGDNSCYAVTASSYTMIPPATGGVFSYPPVVSDWVGYLRSLGLKYKVDRNQ